MTLSLTPTVWVVLALYARASSGVFVVQSTPANLELLLNT